MLGQLTTTNEKIYPYITAQASNKLEPKWIRKFKQKRCTVCKNRGSEVFDKSARFFGENEIKKNLPMHLKRKKYMKNACHTHLETHSTKQQ